MHGHLKPVYHPSGKPSALYADTDVDWAPSLNLGQDKTKRTAADAAERSTKSKERHEKRRCLEAARSLLVLSKGRDVQKSGAVDALVRTESRRTERETSVPSQTDIRGVLTLITIMESELTRLVAENSALDQILKTSSPNS